jgi:pimeloyl-ACP methyl ester carboxylesterase
LPQTAGWRYEEHGGGNLGPPLVFVHGAGGSRLHWPPSLRRLAGSRTLAVDLPGHGRPSIGEAGGIDDYARGLSGWQAAVPVHRPVLVGHSMGSAIALTAALAEPAALAGLVLIGAGARLRVNPRLLEGVARPETFAASVDQIVRWSFAAAAEARLVELARARLLETGSAVLAADLRACDAFDVAARLGEIGLPTLIIVGGDDRMTPPPLSEELRAGIAGARAEVIAGGGHMVMLERPEAIGRLLQSFLTDLSRSPNASAAAKGDKR